MAVNSPRPMSLEFLPRVEGRPTAAVVKQGETVMRLVKSLPLSPLSASRLKGYAGAYVSEELLGAVYHIDLEKDGLVLKSRSLPRTVLRPMADDQFAGGALSLDFTRGVDKEIAGFKLSEPGLVGIEFVPR